MSTRPAKAAPGGDDTHKLSTAALARLAAHDRATAHLRDGAETRPERPEPA